MHAIVCEPPARRAVPARRRPLRLPPPTLLHPHRDAPTPPGPSASASSTRDRRGTASAPRQDGRAGCRRLPDPSRGSPQGRLLDAEPGARGAPVPLRRRAGAPPRTTSAPSPARSVPKRLPVVLTPSTRSRPCSAHLDGTHRLIVEPCSTAPGSAARSAPPPRQGRRAGGGPPRRARGQGRPRPDHGPAVVARRSRWPTSSSTSAGSTAATSTTASARSTCRRRSPASTRTQPPRRPGSTSSRLADRSLDPSVGCVRRRHHVSPSLVQKAVRRARAAGVEKPVTPHVLPSQLRHAHDRARGRHPDGPGAAGPQGRPDDGDLHARPQPRRPRGRQPAGRALDFGSRSSSPHALPGECERLRKRLGAATYPRRGHARKRAHASRRSYVSTPCVAPSTSHRTAHALACPTATRSDASYRDTDARRQLDATPNAESPPVVASPRRVGHRLQQACYAYVQDARAHLHASGAWTNSVNRDPTPNALSTHASPPSTPATSCTIASSVGCCLRDRPGRLPSGPAYFKTRHPHLNARTRKPSGRPLRALSWVEVSRRRVVHGLPTVPHVVWSKKASLPSLLPVLLQRTCLAPRVSCSMVRGTWSGVSEARGLK